MSRGVEIVDRVKIRVDVGGEVEGLRNGVEVGESAKLSEGAATEGVF